MKKAGISITCITLLLICTPLFGSRATPLQIAYGAYFDYAVVKGEVTDVVYAEKETPGVTQIKVLSQAGLGVVPEFIYIFTKPKSLSPSFRPRRWGADASPSLKKGVCTYFRVVKDSAGILTPIPRSPYQKGDIPWEIIRKAFSLRKELQNREEKERLKTVASFLTSGDPVKIKLAMTLSTWKQPWTEEFLNHVDLKDPDVIGTVAISGHIKFYLGHNQYLKPLGRLWSKKPTDELIAFYKDRNKTRLYRRMIAQEALVVKAQQGDKKAVHLWMGVINNPGITLYWERIPAIEALNDKTERKEILKEFIKRLEALPLGQSTSNALLQGLANGGEAGLEYITGCLTGKNRMPKSKWGTRIGESLALKIKDPELGPRMTELLSHRGKNARVFACAALGSMQYSKAADKLLEVYNGTAEHPEIVAAAGKALLAMKPETAVPFGRKILSTKDPIIFAWKTGPRSSINYNMKSTAIRLLSHFNTAESADSLISFIRAKPHNPKDAYLESKALKGLAGMNTEKAHVFIRQYLLNEALPSLGAQIIKILAENRMPESAGTLKEIADKQDHALFLPAAAALIKMPAQAKDFCDKLLGSDKPRSRVLDYLLVKGLAQCKGNTYARHEVTYLSYNHPGIRALAITGLWARFKKTLGYDPFMDLKGRIPVAARWKKHVN
ncbi:HEAT repeat domain-containing protein [Planctomycetota bacterium]